MSTLVTPLARRSPRVSHVGAPGRRRQWVRVLVCDGDTRTALATARSLVAAGHYVWAAAPARSLAGVSWGVRSVRIAANPLDAPEEYARQVARACERLQIEVLLPVTDASADALLDHAHLLPSFVELPLPDLATFRRGTDKAQMLALASAAGFAVPATVEVLSADDIDSAVEHVTLPVVVKPHRSVVRNPDGTARRLDVQVASHEDTLRECLRALPPAAYPVLLQERIHGDGEGCFALRWNGELIACFAHRRLREKPPAGGVSVFRESIEVPRELRAAAERLLDALDWQGVAMIECKRDATTGRHVFLELNGRLWGSLQLAIDAGVDFPALLVSCALGDDAARAQAVSFTPGVRSQWFWGDMDHLYARLFKSARTLQLDARAPSALRTLVEVLRTPLLSGVHAEVERWSDPLPALLEWSRRLSFSAPSASAVERRAPTAPLDPELPPLDPMPRRKSQHAPRD
jgi:predicted ATP-grasp superfamily ATP-dependent carboligase